MMEQGSHRLTGGKYFVDETSYVEGYTGFAARTGQTEWWTASL